LLEKQFQNNEATEISLSCYRAKQFKVVKLKGFYLQLFFIVFLGAWVDDQRHGHGKYAYVNADMFEGEWNKHERHGQGVYSYALTGSRYVGTWVMGKPEGAGELIHANHRYQGNWTEGNMQGPGKYIFDIGCEQHGEFIPVEQPQEDGEEEEQMIVTVSKWKAGQITDITLFTNEEVDPCADEDEVKEGASGDADAEEGAEIAVVEGEGESGVKEEGEGDEGGDQDQANKEDGADEQQEPDENVAATDEQPRAGSGLGNDDAAGGGAEGTDAVEE